MKKILVPAMVCCTLAMALSPCVAEGTAVEDERASVFVAGTADPSEMFGPSEGQTLLVLAFLAMLVPFVLLMFGARTHRRCKAKLDEIEATLLARDGSHD